MNAVSDSRVPTSTVSSRRRSFARVGLVALVAILAIPLLPGLVAAPTTGNSAGALAPLGSHAKFAASPVSPTTHLTSLPVVNGRFAGTNVPATGFPASAFARPQVSSHAVAVAAAPSGLGGSSTSSNFFVNSSDCQGWGQTTAGFQFPLSFAGSAITNASGSNRTLVAAGGSLQGAYNYTGGNLCNTFSVSPAFAQSGVTEVARSTDGGHTWPASTFLSINTTHWATMGDPSNGSIHWGSPTIASGPNNNVIVADIYIFGCYFALGCSNATGLQRDWGVSVARSTDGGQTFGPTEQLTATQGLQWESFPTNCTSFASNFYYLNVPERPALAINPATGVAILTWDQFHANINTAGCSDLGTAQVMYSTSSDGGKTWSTPKGLSGDLSELSQVAIGPSPSYTVTATFLDFQNGSGSAISIEATSSSNSGSTWSTPKDVVLAGYYFPVFPSGAGFSYGFGTILSMAADGHAGSLYSTHVYEAWADNGNITTNPGYATIEVSVSANSGTSFAPPVAITPVSTSTIYVEPTVTTDDQGVVWVTFLGITISSGNYNTYGVLSTDGGTTWSSPFLVSDSVSTPGSTINDIGLYTGAIGTSNGAYPVWTDCSSASCAVSADAQLVVANVHPVSISANITGVNATITTFGASKTSRLPTVVGWDNASTSTVTVPQFLPDPANSSDVYTFQAWSGISTSLNYQASVTYSGTGTQLVANYAAVPAAVIRGTVAPNVPGLALKVNNAPVSLTPYNATALQYLISVPGGLTYTLVASAPNYASQTHPVQTSQSGTYYWNFTLTKRLGYFVGQLTPSSATLKVNGSVVTTVNPVTGLFNIPEPFGWYWLNASGTGLTASNQYLEVLAGQNVTVNIVLIGGWVQGVVLGAQPSKPGLTVKIDGVPIPVSAAGTFNNSTLGGFHTLTATQAGYNLSSMSLFVSPGHATLVNVTLTNRGWISGIIQPAAAVKTALLHIYSGAVGQYYAVAADGTFNVSLVGAPKYTVNVTSTGYTSFQNSSVVVTPGNGTQVSVTLTLLPTGCTTNCNHNPPGNNATPSGGLTTTELILIVVVIVVVAAVAVVLLMRRRGGGSAPEAYDEGGEGGQVYESSNPADLPRLQSDGTMGPGNPPPPPG